MKAAQFYTQIKTQNGFRGSQVKTWDYFNFVNSHKDYNAYISFHKESEWSEDVYWSKGNILNSERPLPNPDIYILKGGKDWLLFDSTYKRNVNTPVISPIVNYRVLDSSHPSNKLLSRRAIRVCPNPDLTRKISLYKNINGPVFHVPHGLDLSTKTKKYENKNIDLVILAIKNPKMGAEIYKSYKNRISLKTVLIDKTIPYKTLMQYFSNSKVVLHLPQKKESFYLPGLESISLGCITIMPNCVGNVFYGLNNPSVFICNYKLNSIKKIIHLVLGINDLYKKEFSYESIKIAKKFSLEAEENKWHNILDNIDELYYNA